MENYKLIIYILIGVIYFIFKNRKKQPQPVRPAPVRTRDTFSESKKTDILNKGSESTDKENVQKESFTTLESKGIIQSINPVDYDDLVADEEENLVDSRMKDSDRESKEMFEPYLNKDSENEYSKLLNKPESLKQAIILKEILTPKHF